MSMNSSPSPSARSLTRSFPSMKIFDSTQNLNVVYDSDSNADDDSHGTALESDSNDQGGLRQRRGFGRNQQAEQGQDLTEVEEMARRDTFHVRAWRSVVLIMILLVGVIVSVSTYLFLTNEEERDYEETYELFVGNMEATSKVQIKGIFDATRGLAETVTASALASNQSFPFVTVPLFEVPGRQARIQSSLEVFLWCPLIVGEEDRETWKNYSIAEQGWVADSRDVAMAQDEDSASDAKEETPQSIIPFLWSTTAQGELVERTSGGPYAPLWQTSPPPFDPSTLLNRELLADVGISRLVHVVSLTNEAVFSETMDLSPFAGTLLSKDAHDAIHTENSGVEALENTYDHPHSLLVQPVFDQLSSTANRNIVGIVVGVVPWDRFLNGLLPDGVSGIYAVLENSCGKRYTYILNGNKAQFVGDGDLHEEAYDETMIRIPLGQYQNELTDDTKGHCEYSILAYSSSSFRGSSESDNLPMIFTTAIACIFFLMAMTFVMYDMFVRRRNARVVKAAARSNAILSSLFPSNFRDRLFAHKEETNKEMNVSNSGGSHKSRLRSYLTNGPSESTLMGAADMDEDGLYTKSKPIADLFPETTILFADIAGFTAWSSVREPSQVFILLESLYHAFDEIAKKRRVFKVETVGDCYVAVTGLPDPQKDHAVVMARFARDCMHKTRFLTKKLEVVLGPDTGDLTMRMGLHSGPVTAGVLRGDRARFQLFGDTMNTAARMESTGLRDRIQISQETADLLIGAGKSDWVKIREEKIVAKGKGEMQTYFLLVGNDRSDTASTQSSSSFHEEEEKTDLDDMHREVYQGKTARLIDWNVDVISRVLKQIVAHRRARKLEDAAPADEHCYKEKRGPIVDEVKEIIMLPAYSADIAKKTEAAEDIELDPEVVAQLHDYVCNIAAMYRDNPFHNFEHASHVTMSVVKLMSRIVAPSDIDVDDAYVLHDHTYGITSDPLTQFACVFSALIHDVDHSGVPNAQLVKEGSKLAEYYDDQSVAEQNSVDLAWRLLMDDNYADLRGMIYTNDAELRRFRQLVVNSVMATDIVDKELKTLRNSRWDTAFSESAVGRESQEDINRKATIVIEHLIQASDVAHTMQHWHIYRKWNERFFMECYEGYKAGRAEKNPADSWYEGELGFFDFYIIPLAKKLKDCGVFGVSSDEYLNYAERNRKEWEERGREVVSEMVEAVTQQSGKERAGSDKRLKLSRAGAGASTAL